MSLPVSMCWSTSNYLSLGNVFFLWVCVKKLEKGMLYDYEMIVAGKMEKDWIFSSITLTQYQRPLDIFYDDWVRQRSLFNSKLFSVSDGEYFPDEDDSYFVGGLVQF